jgi:Rrf2 family nitric oxide-sensitive transcriptional repressor
MQLTLSSDYALRVLMYLALAPDRLATIDEIARSYGISSNHLMKVVHGLALRGYIETVRGRSGGMRLARPAEDITVGAVLRDTEENFALVACMGDEDACRITRICRLRQALGQALDAYFEVLDGWTLANLVASPQRLRSVLSVP